MARKFCAYTSNPAAYTFPCCPPKIPGSGPPFFGIHLTNKAPRRLAGLLLIQQRWNWKSTEEDFMIAIHVDNLSDLTVIECKGRIIRDESVFQLRDAVLAH